MTNCVSVLTAKEHFDFYIGLLSPTLSETLVHWGGGVSSGPGTCPGPKTYLVRGEISGDLSECK